MIGLDLALGGPCGSFAVHQSIDLANHHDESRCLHLYGEGLWA